MVTRRTFVKGAVAAPLVGAVVVRLPRPAGAQDDPVRIGSKDFPEQFILGEMYGLLLENAGIPVEVTTNLGGTGVAHEALINDQIDMYPEYPGTALEVILKIPFAEFKAQFAGTPAAATPAAATPSMATPTMATPGVAGTPAAGGTSLDAAVFETVAAYYREQFNVVLLDQSAFNDTQALAVKRSFAEERGITTISQLAEIAGDLKISAPVDFPEREDGLLGLQRVYGAGFDDIEVLGVQPGLKYEQLQDDTAQVVLAFSTDGEIAAFDLVVLEDDRGLWPPYHCAPFVRAEVLDAYPAIPDALNPVQPILTNEVMSGLNARVAIDGEEPVDVARAFLQENGLIAGQ